MSRPGELGAAIRAYQRLYLVRRCEETIQKHYAEDEMKTPVHLSIGQEAPVVGVCEALAPEDRIFGTYRSHALYLARTDDTDGFFGELYGRVTGAARGKAGSMHIAAPRRGLMMTSGVVATTIPLALGAALALERQRSSGRAVTFFGGGATGEGVFWESLNFACLERLRVVFVCEVDGLPIHSRRESRDGHAGLPRVLESFDCIVRSSDSTDVIELRDLVAGALREQDERGRPIFLSLACDESEAWKLRDPVSTTRARLLGIGIDEDIIGEVERAVDARVGASVARARLAPLPPLSDLHQGVYA